jgi:hypothetical protein
MLDHEAIPLGQVVGGAPSGEAPDEPVPQAGDPGSWSAARLASRRRSAGQVGAVDRRCFGHFARQGCRCGATSVVMFGTIQMERGVAAAEPRSPEGMAGQEDGAAMCTRVSRQPRGTCPELQAAATLSRLNGPRGTARRRHRRDAGSPPTSGQTRPLQRSGLRGNRGIGSGPTLHCGLICINAGRRHAGNLMSGGFRCGAAPATQDRVGGLKCTVSRWIGSLYWRSGC